MSVYLQVPSSQTSLALARYDKAPPYHGGFLRGQSHLITVPCRRHPGWSATLALQ